jgi:hypothetical protein
MVATHPSSQEAIRRNNRAATHRSKTLATHRKDITHSSQEATHPSRMWVIPHKAVAATHRNTQVVILLKLVEATHRKAEDTRVDLICGLEPEVTHRMAEVDVLQPLGVVVRHLHLRWEHGVLQDRVPTAC